MIDNQGRDLFLFPFLFIMRKIIHIDMDAFFASVEQRNHPEYRGKPLIVAGSPDKRGVVSTCSYEARVFGVHSAMPTRTAMNLCPHGIFIEGDMQTYKEVSDTIFAIFYKYTTKVEPMSIDEAFLDVTDSVSAERSATMIASQILRDIFNSTGLTASAGVSYNKFLAKVASSLRKPAGLSVIKPSGAISFLENLPIEKFYGIGKVTAKKLRSMNIKSGKDLKALDLQTLISHFGKAGAFYYNIVRGIDEREVETDSVRKSYGRETTLISDITDMAKIRIYIRRLSIKVANYLKRDKITGRTVTLKLKYSDFQTVTRAKSFTHGIADAAAIGEIACELLQKTEAGSRPVRLIGVSISNFSDLSSPTRLSDIEQLELPFE